MTAAWILDIYAKSPAALFDPRDMKLFSELYDFIQIRDIELLRHADLTDSIPYSRIRFLKKLVLRWNKGGYRFQDRELQEKLERLLATADDLDIEIFKHGMPLPSQANRFLLVPPREKLAGEYSAVTRQNLAQIRSLIRLLWQHFAALERSASAKFYPMGVTE
ncbi:hypothetical protein [Aestuariispira insulae]|uniref:Uncharacterized protein n=1 Tax=Aestuariispira insulae TaxID=1461337 RepID=A0A3D9HNC1_9PROT|nr:hypothetical protein [Aestuariispira insulae]RED50990.1 hypothetical protein DFP90_104266 [Aestuariispira insulae]